MSRRVPRKVRVVELTGLPLLDADDRTLGDMVRVCRFFFFQAEDGIRDHCVTGVQTCALPISCFAREGDDTLAAGRPLLGVPDLGRASFMRCAFCEKEKALRRLFSCGRLFGNEIGRASCRARVYISVVAVSLKKKKKNKNERS